MKLNVVLLGLLLSITSAGQIPTGYYNSANGLNGSQLKSCLHGIIKGHVRFSYSYLWTSFVSTDDKPNGTVWDMYSDIPNGTPPYVFYFGTSQCSTIPGFEGGCYNREHSFPKSWMGAVESDTMYTDMFHLIPTDSYVNTRRSNYPYGQVGATSWTSQNGSKLGSCSTIGYSGTVFEPLNEYKGDVARNYFYVATRYESRIAGWATNDANGDAILDGSAYPCFEPWYINMLLAWHSNDPVSQKEIDRNNEIYYFNQHNRNPFIDHPEYANAIWNPGTTVLPEPTNFPTNFSANNIHLEWVDANGAILPDGYLLRMSSTGFNAIPVPVDGLPVTNSETDKNVPYGVQGAWFTGLAPNTTYYFKMYGYTGAGSGINYKLDESVPQVQMSTSP